MPEPALRRLGRLVGIEPELGDPAAGAAPDVPVRALEGGSGGYEFGLWRARRYPTEEAAVMQLAQVLHYAFPEPPGRYRLHAAALVRDGAAFVFLGPGRVGKSTLAAEAWRRGALLLGDDVVSLDAAGDAVEAVPKPMKLRLARPEPPPWVAGLDPGHWAVGPLDFEDGPALQLGRGLPRAAPLGEAFPLGGVFVVRREPSRGWRSEPIDKYALVAGVIEGALEGDGGRPLAVVGSFLRLLVRGGARTLVVGDGASAEAAAGVLGL